MFCFILPLSAAATVVAVAVVEDDVVLLVLMDTSSPVSESSSVAPPKTPPSAGEYAACRRRFRGGFRDTEPSFPELPPPVVESAVRRLIRIGGGCCWDLPLLDGDNGDGEVESRDGSDLTADDGSGCCGAGGAEADEVAVVVSGVGCVAEAVDPSAEDEDEDATGSVLVSAASAAAAAAAGV